MGTEIERRFLLKNPRWRPDGIKPVWLDQGRFALGNGTCGRVEYLWGLPRFDLTRAEEKIFSLLLPWQDGIGLIAEGIPEKLELTCFGMATELPSGWMARIRGYDDMRYVLDIKGPRSGTTRKEFGEYPVSAEEGRALLELAPQEQRLRKKRYTIPHQGHDWVLDVYADGKSRPTCEVELPSPTTPLDLPLWVGEEITDRKTFWTSTRQK